MAAAMAVAEPRSSSGAVTVGFGVVRGVIPIAMFTTAAVHHIAPVLIKAGRTMGLGPVEMAWRILLPAARPEISPVCGLASR